MTPPLPSNALRIAANLRELREELELEYHTQAVGEAIDYLLSAEGQIQQAATDLERECAAVDALLRLLGLEPEACRSEGGAINIPRVRVLLDERTSS